MVIEEKGTSAVIGGGSAADVACPGLTLTWCHHLPPLGLRWRLYWDSSVRRFFSSFLTFLLNSSFLSKISHGNQHKNKADRAELPPMGTGGTLCPAEHNSLYWRGGASRPEVVYACSLKASSYPVKWLQHQSSVCWPTFRLQTGQLETAASGLLIACKMSLSLRARAFFLLGECWRVGT